MSYRPELEPLAGQVIEATAVLGRRSKARVVLLKDVQDLNGEQLTDHAWCTAQFGPLSVVLREARFGDAIRIVAPVVPYAFGHHGERSYTLSTPLEASLLSRGGA